LATIKASNPKEKLKIPLLPNCFHWGRSKRPALGLTSLDSALAPVSGGFSQG
jgi:hypothetical protein